MPVTLRLYIYKAQSHGTGTDTGIFHQAAAQGGMADTGVRGKDHRHIPPVQAGGGLPARRAGRTQSLCHGIPFQRPGRRNTLLQGAEAAYRQQDYLLQQGLSDRTSFPKREHRGAERLHPFGNAQAFHVLPAEFELLRVLPHGCHLLGQQIFPAWEA